MQGGLANLEHLLRFVSDTVGMTGFGFDPPAEVPATGVYYRSPEHVTPRPHVAVLFYRAHLIAGQHRLRRRPVPGAGGPGRPGARRCGATSLRPDAGGRVEALDLLRPSTARRRGHDGAGVGHRRPPTAWRGMPPPSAPWASRWSRPSRPPPRTPEWEAARAGFSPSTWPCAWPSPSSTGASSAVPFSFNEEVDDGDTLGSPGQRLPHRARPGGAGRRPGRPGWPGLRRTPPAERRVAIVLSAYPTKRSRIGNAVALDTPASVDRPAARLGRRRLPGRPHPRRRRRPDARADRHLLLRAARRSRPTSWPGRRAAGRPTGLPGLVVGASIRAARATVEAAWGAAPGDVYRDPADGDLVFAGLDLGGVFVAVQPPRGFGEQPVAVYHSPDLPPTHHYLAFYRWLDEGWGADAIVHAGKHGTLEWLPGKGVGLSAACFPDLALGDMPLIYPFVVNDPGEGTQAKRRAHATIVDHLLPPMTRAETYDDLARLEQLLDEHAQVAALDPSKLPAIRRKVWDLLVSAELHRDLGVADAAGGRRVRRPDHPRRRLPVRTKRCPDPRRPARPGSTSGRGGPPRSVGCPHPAAAGRGAVVAGRGGPAASGPEGDALAEVDAVEAECRRLLAGWLRPVRRPSRRVLDWVSGRLVPALDRTHDEVEHVLAALDGRWMPPGPSGAPTRGMAHVLPTGRNFYSVDPKALPSRLAWEVGQALAARLLERSLADEGRYPASVGLVVWGTAAMRTGGDDVAEALALLGVRPVWQAESGRVIGRRADSRRRAGPAPRRRGPAHLRFLPGRLPAPDQPCSTTPCELAGFADGDPRIFGAKPGAYGSGILPLHREPELAQRRGPGQRCTWPGAATATAGPVWAYRPLTPCAVASPPSRWRSRTRTTASTTSSTPMTTSRTTGA